MERTRLQVATKMQKRNRAVAAPVMPASPRRGDETTTFDGCDMIRKLKSGQYRLYSRKIDPKTGRRRNLGTFPNRAKAEKHERAVQYFKRHR